MADLDDSYLPLTSLDPTVSAQPAPASAYLEGGRAVESRRGWGWIRDGFGYFRRQAGMWGVLALIFFGLVVAMNLVPFVGWLASTLLIPVFVAGLMTGCQTMERGGELELAHLFAGFRHHTGQLVLVGLIGFGLTVVAMIPMIVVMGAGLFSPMSDGASAAFAGMGFVLALLISLALFVPINMAMWFASALVMLQGQSAPRAIGQSFRGCLKNIVPFLVYGVVLFALAMIASIPFGLGWLVLGPVLLCSVYTAYRDIFCQS